MIVSARSSDGVRYHAQATTTVAAAGSAAAGGVASAAGAGGGAAGGSAGGAGAILSMIGAVQFLPLLGQLSIDIDPIYRDFAASMAVFNLQLQLPSWLASCDEDSISASAWLEGTDLRRQLSQPVRRLNEVKKATTQDLTEMESGTKQFLESRDTTAECLLYGNVFWVGLALGCITGLSILIKLLTCPFGKSLGHDMRWRRLIFISMWYLHKGLVQSCIIAIVEPCTWIATTLAWVVLVFVLMAYAVCFVTTEHNLIRGIVVYAPQPEEVLIRLKCPELGVAIKKRAKINHDQMCSSGDGLVLFEGGEELTQHIAFNLRTIARIRVRRPYICRVTIPVLCCEFSSNLLP